MKIKDKSQFSNTFRLHNFSVIRTAALFYHRLWICRSRNFSCKHR